MTEFNMDRKHAKRELERAVGNIAWSIQHLVTVKEGFVSAAMRYAELEQDVPDSYAETINQLDEIIAAAGLVGESIKGVNEAI